MAASNDKEILDYSVNLDNPVEWTSTSTLGEVQDKTRGDVKKNLNDEIEINSEIPEKLANFRKIWEEKMPLDKDTKNAIINAVNRIQTGIPEEESDGSVLVKFELGGKEYQALDVNLAEHSDIDYIIQSIALTYGEWKTIKTLDGGGMIGDDTNNRENKTLKKYVEEQKNNRKMEIKTLEFMHDLIDKLGDEAGLTKESDKIAMWMYLTGNYGYYILKRGNDWYYGLKGNNKTLNGEVVRCGIYCTDKRRTIMEYHGYNSTNLCLIACK